MRVASASNWWRGPLLKLGIALFILFIAWFLIQRPFFIFLFVILGIVILVGILIFFDQKGTFSLERVAMALLGSAILLPFIRIPGPVPDVRPEFIITIAAWTLLILRYFVTGNFIRLRYFPTYKWFWFFAFCITISMLYASIFKGQPLIWRDFWELVKIILYFLLFALMGSLNISPTKLTRYYKIALVFLIISSFVGFLQYFDFLGINQIISPYYAPTQIRGLIVHGRITGTTPNPNEFGALMVLATSLAFSAILFARNQQLRLLAKIALPIFIIALIFTMSRTSLVSLFLAIGTILFLFLKIKIESGWKIKRIIEIGLVGCLAGLFIIISIPEKAVFRYSELMYFTETTSWQGRVMNWEINFAIWKASPWLGWGPGKATMGTIVDNEWLLLLRRYGIVGLTVFLGLFVSLFFTLSRIGRNNPEPTVIALTVALQGTLIGYALYMALASIYHSLQLMPILLLFLGLAYSQWRARQEGKIL